MGRHLSTVRRRPTKLQERQNFAEIRRRGVHTLNFEPDFTVGKKVNRRLLEERERKVGEAADVGVVYSVRKEDEKDADHTSSGSKAEGLREDDSRHGR